MTLDDITNEMRTRVAAKGGIAGKTIKFNFGDDGVVRVANAENPATVDNQDGPADCTVKVAMSDFIEISQGRMDSMMAFMSGKLKVEGDMSLAMQLGNILR